MIKRFFNLLLLSALCSMAHAQLNGDGYYRIQNVNRQRYIAVLDSTGWIKATTGGVEYDLYSLRTLKEKDNNIVSNPATILYIKKVDDGYTFMSQGIDTRKLTSHVLTIKDMGNNVYRASGEIKNTARVVLSDPWNAEEDSGCILTSGTSTRDWYIKPVKQSTSCYFGFAPTLQVGGKYYQSFYASFPWRTLGNGVKVYYVSKIFNNQAVLTAIADGTTIPAATPVIVECTSANPSDNQIELITGTYTSISGNLLKGNYFCYEYGSGNKYHFSKVAFDASSMRTLGVGKNGKLCFITPGTATLDKGQYLPGNCAYLTVKASNASELPIIDKDQYTLGIENLNSVTTNNREGIYTISGTRVNNATNLQHGVYIINGKKVMR